MPSDDPYISNWQSKHGRGGSHAPAWSPESTKDTLLTCTNCGEEYLSPRHRCPSDEE